MRTYDFEYQFRINDRVYVGDETGIIIGTAPSKGIAPTFRVEVNDEVLLVYGFDLRPVNYNPEQDPSNYL